MKEVKRIGGHVEGSGAGLRNKVQNSVPKELSFRVGSEEVVWCGRCGQRPLFAWFLNIL